MQQGVVQHLEVVQVKDDKGVCHLGVVGMQMKEHINQIGGSTPVVKACQGIPLRLHLQGALHPLLLIDVSDDEVDNHVASLKVIFHVDVALEPPQLFSLVHGPILL